MVNMGLCDSMLYCRHHRHRHRHQALLFLVMVMVMMMTMAMVLAVSNDADDEVKGLLGQPRVNFKHYAGHIYVKNVYKDRDNGNAAKHNPHTRALFYWFFEADRDRRTSLQLPLAIWFNGGPGCSSVGNGALAELGPFTPNPTADGLELNPYSWTKEANIVFVESPFAVGFSYSNVSSDYNHFSDASIAEDAYSFIINWLEKFPEYKSNDFYLLGESYAGHYIPTLARLILQRNKATQVINFKGFAIGNPWTDAAFDNAGTTDFYRSHSLISDETYAAIQANCNYADELPVDAASNNTFCNRAVSEADADMAQIDIYNIYAESCNSNTSQNAKKQFAYRLTSAYVDPCIDTVTPYLNRPEVQRALHASDSPVVWSGCSSMVYAHYKREDIVASMLPLYQELIQHGGLKIWIYSGDVDGVVSTLATRMWIKALNLPVETPWYAWNFQNQVGGWTQKYRGLTFITVRGAGHMVPANKPPQALALFRSFLAGDMLPSF